MTLRFPKFDEKNQILRFPIFIWNCNLFDFLIAAKLPIFKISNKLILPQNHFNEFEQYPIVIFFGDILETTWPKSVTSRVSKKMSSHKISSDKETAVKFLRLYKCLKNMKILLVHTWPVHTEERLHPSRENTFSQFSSTFFSVYLTPSVFEKRGKVDKERLDTKRILLQLN